MAPASQLGEEPDVLFALFQLVAEEMQEDARNKEEKKRRGGERKKSISHITCRTYAFAGGLNIPQ